jgi:murein DD-endopeptidase MepM/ murein hydrolase activator NlpD
MARAAVLEGDLAAASARAVALESALAALEARPATVPDPPAEVAAPDPGMSEPAAAALAELDARAAWLAAALGAETDRRRALEATAAAGDARNEALAAATEALARLLATTVDDRLAPVRALLAAVRMEGPGLARILAAAPGVGGPFVPLPAPADDLFVHLPPAAAGQLRAAMDGAATMRTLCRLADRIPAGMPVAATGQPSGFGRRIDPFTRQPAFHTGVDLSAPTGTPVTVAAPGRVAGVARHPEYGLVVDVDHGFGIVTRYGHLSTVLVRNDEGGAGG